MDTITEGPEEHRFTVESHNNQTFVQEQYVPDKSPILSVEDVSGIVDGSSYQFIQGVDYEVVDTDNDGRSEAIDFGIGGENPDANTTFTITYTCKSVIVRYLSSYQNKLDTTLSAIEDVIESHYVDTASGTGIIDSFEDESLSEYELQTGLQSQFQIQASKSKHGEFALQLDPMQSQPVRIASEQGLPTYPQRGDTITLDINVSNVNARPEFDIFWSDENGNEQFYRVLVDVNARALGIGKNGPPPASVPKSDIDIVPSGVDIVDAWFELEIDIAPVGNISVTLDDGDVTTGSATAHITDSQYTGGGLRIGSRTDGGPSTVYVDDIRVEQRNSADLDRVGALFGPLGRRRGRNDAEYRAFLRSIVQSFSGRGTVDGIKFAVAAGIDIPESDVIVTEDFQSNSYSITVLNPNGINSSVVDEMAELADPSGIGLDSIQYSGDPFAIEITFGNTQSQTDAGSFAGADFFDGKGTFSGGNINGLAGGFGANFGVGFSTTTVSGDDYSITVAMTDTQSSTDNTGFGTDTFDGTGRFNGE
jgi:hypothetical protein